MHKKVWIAPKMTQLNVSETAAKGGNSKKKSGTEARGCATPYNINARLTSCS